MSFSSQQLRPIFKNFSETLLEKVTKKNNKMAFKEANELLKTDYSNPPKIEEDDGIIQHSVCSGEANSVTRERVILLARHYQRKFNETKKEEFNIFTLDIDKKIEPHILESLLSDGITEDNPKKIVIYDSSDGHATGLLVTHDKKIMMLFSSTLDRYKYNGINKILRDNGLDKKYKMSMSFYEHQKFGLYQKDYISCVMLAFKHLKLLAANNARLFKQIKPLNDLEFMLPPEVFRYAQSDEFLEKYIPFYQEKNHLDDMQTQLIADNIKKYRDDNFAQLRMLYHQIKHFSGSEERKEEILEQLQNYQ